MGGSRNAWAGATPPINMLGSLWPQPDEYVHCLLATNIGLLQLSESWVWDKFGEGSTFIFGHTRYPMLLMTQSKIGQRKLLTLSPSHLNMRISNKKLCYRRRTAYTHTSLAEGSTGPGGATSDVYDWLVFFSHHILCRVCNAEIRTTARCLIRNFMNEVTKKKFTISKIAI